MKNSKKVVLGIVLFITSLINVQAQDVITMKGGKTLEVKITELDEYKIKYYESSDENQLIFTMQRALIQEIQFGFGKKHVEVPPTLVNPYYFTGDRTQIVKINFTGIAGNTLIVSYEKSIKPEYSLETSIKFAGVGINGRSFERSGFAFDIGPKFKMKSILKKSDEYRPRHLLHGSYFKPAFGLNFLEIEDIDESKIFANLGLDVGKQWIFNNIISLDVFIGFHYLIGVTAVPRPYEDRGFLRGDEHTEIHVGDLAGDDNSALSFGVKIGLLVGAEKK